MPHSRYDEAQLQLAHLLISKYYSEDPQRFSFIIKQMILHEATAAMPELNTTLRNSTVARQLFKFGVVCYDKDSFLTYLTRETTTGEFLFLEDNKVGFDDLLRVACETLAGRDSGFDLRGDITQVFQSDVPDVVLDSSVVVTLDHDLVEEWQSLRSDLQDTFAAVSPAKCEEINAGNAVMVIFGGEEHTVLAADQALLEKKNVKENPEPSGCCCVM